MIFVQPTSIIELAAALAEKEGKTILAAGCTDILPGKIGRPWDADRIIDLTHIPELQQIAVENFFQYPAHIVVVDALAAVTHTGKAA